MQPSLVTVGVLLGLDSFVVAAALGAAGPPLNRRWLAAAFGMCDGCASLLGWAIDMQRLRSSWAWCEWLAPIAVCGYSLYVLCLAWKCQRLAQVPKAGWLPFGLPVCLSLDNLVTGIGADVAGGPALMAALVLGLLSGYLAFVGLRLSAVLAGWAPARAEWLGGLLLILTAIALFCQGVLS
jgi:putative Mn2+ efflux pump MntP